jgi:large repetitive protein
MNKLVLILGFLIFAFSVRMNAQFSAVPTPAVNAATLASKLAGKGIIISNPTLVCPNGAAATFTALSTSLGLDSGIVITTGNVLTYTSGANTNFGVNGAASLSAKTDNLTIGGDADLATSAGQAQTFLHDMCKLEFDFIPLNDTLKINYKFASEEYPEYNCTQFNDVFGLYISGPGYATPTNIALIPGTTIPVSVNSVNDGTTSFFGNIANCTSLGIGAPFTALYTNNAASSNIIYDGFTNLFQAKAAVTPCSTYHFKIAIADLGDGDRDSGLFLKSGSFVSDAATIDSVVSASNLITPLPYVMEGCSSAVVHISRPFAKPTPLVIGISGAGTAISGTDYTIPMSVTIPSNATTATFNVTASNDNITEGTEIIKLYIYGSICVNIPTDSVQITLLEFPKYSVSDNDTICVGQSATLTATSITLPNQIIYTWNPGNFIGPTHVYSPLVNTNYTVSAKHPGCAARDSVVAITVSPLPTVNAGLDKTICNASSTVLNGIVSGFSPFGITHQWQPNGALSNGTILNSVASPLISTTYTLTSTNSAGCSKSDIMLLTIAPPLTQTVNVSNALCNGGATGTATITTLGAVGGITYNLQPGNVSNTNGIFTSLSAGAYTVSSTDAAACNKTITFIIGQGNIINFNNPIFVSPNCNGQNNGGFTITSSGGFGTISYSLLPGGVTSTTGNYQNLIGGIYTITAIDAQGCTKTNTLNLIQPVALSWSSVTKTNATCNGYTNGAINSGVTGGNGGNTFKILPQNITNSSGTFANLSAGTYSISAQDAKGCSTSSVVVITQPLGMNFNAPSINAPSCTIGNNGSFTITATGGAAPVIYNIAPVGTTNSTGIFAGLGIGAFIVTATDVNGCTKSSIVNLSYTNAPAFSSVTKISVNCFGQNNGSIAATTIGGIGAVTYTLNPGSIGNTTGNYPNLIAGVYTVIAKDANQCTTVSTVIITTPAVLGFGTVLATGPLCNGAANGNLNLSMTGGTSAFTFTITPGGSSNTTGIFSNLNIGAYTVNIVDAKGCTKSTAFSLTQPNIVSWAGNNTKLDVQCNGSNSGTIGGTATGGTGLIQYTLLPNNITNSSGSFPNLIASIFTVVAKDVNNCSITKTVTITQPPIIILSANNIISATCAPLNNGSFNASAIGGNPAYTFQLTNTGATNNTGIFNTLVSGNYIVKVTDANGCTKTISVNVPTTPPPTIANVLFVNQIQCGIDSSDSLKVIAIGNGPFTYFISPGGTSNTSGYFNNLSPNTYTLVAIDANNCTAATIVLINIPLPLDVFPFSITQPQCANNLTGAMDINASGGIAPYTFNNLTNNTSNNTGIFSSLAAGTYSIEGVDSAGCRDTIAVSIVVPPPLVWTSVTKTNLICNGIASGTITPTANGGTGLITYTLSPGNTNSTSGFTNLLAGTYTIVAKDINNCSISTTVLITQPPLIVLSSPNITSPTCQAPTSGAITFNALGGTGSLTYGNGFTTNSTGAFIGLTANSYILSATDGNGCTKTTLSVLIIPNAPSLNVTAVGVSCIGSINGSFSFFVQGGSAPYSYSYNGGAFNNVTSYSSLAANTYTITAKDFNNCTVSSIVTIPNPPALVFNTPIITHAACFGANTGSITQTAIGGTGTKSYTLLPSSVNTNGQFNTLTAGTYIIQVNDANNCSITITVLVTSPSVINFGAVTKVNPTCIPNNTGSISTLATGGAGGMSYTLLGVGTNTTGNFINLIAGTYTLSAKDANNCITTTTIILATPNAPQINTITPLNVKCFGGNNGSVIIASTGGTGTKSYTLSPGNITNTTGIFNTLSANNYTIQVSDASGCATSSSFIIAHPNQITFNNITNNSPLCNTGATGNIISSAIGGTGAFTYKILPNNITNTTGIFNSLAASSYTISATDVNLCTISTVVNLLAPTAVTWSNFNTVNILCRGDSTGIISCLAIGGTGAINYNLQPGNINLPIGGFNNLYASNYTVVAKDVNNCSISSTIAITQPVSKVTINSTSNTIPTCVPGNDGVLTINATGGTGLLTYTLNNGLSSNTGLINNVGIGNYTLTVMDANSCISTKSLIINNPNAPIPINIVKVGASCFAGNNGSINLGSSGGTGNITYLIQPGLISNATGFFNNLSAQTYTVTLTDSVGCANNANIIVTQPNIISFNATSINAALCFGSTGNIIIGGQGGTGTISYNIQPLNLTNNSGIFNNIPAQTYTATATDIAGCTQSTFVSISTPPALYWFAFNTNTVTCNGGNNGYIAVNARGGTGTITYSVNPGNLIDTIGVYLNLPSAIYTIAVTDANGCSISSTFNISQPPQLAFGTLNSTIPTCLPGNDATLTSIANGGVAPFTYSLNGAAFVNSGIYNNLGAGTYTVTVKDNNNCTYSQTKVIANPGAPNINNLNIITPACFGNTNGSFTTNITGGTGIISYTILPNNTTNINGAFNNLIAGTYTLSIQDAANCTISSVLTITQPNLLQFTSLTNLAPKCNNGNNGIIAHATSGGTGIITFNLLPGNLNTTNDTSFNIAAGSYTIKATDTKGCTTQSTTNVTNPALLQFNNPSVLHPTCNGLADGIISYNAIGGTGLLNYILQNPGTTNNTGIFTNLTGPSTYTVQVLDANNCSKSSVINMTQPTAMNLNLVTITGASCAPGGDGLVEITCTGGTGVLAYNITNGTTNSIGINGIYSNLSNTTYTLNVTDANNCLATDIVQLVAPNAPNITGIIVNAASCVPNNNGSIVINANQGTPAYSYKINNGALQSSNSFNTLIAGNYTAVVQDSKGCSASSIVIVTTTIGVAISGNTFNSVTCFGLNNGTISVQGSTGALPYNYQINPIGGTNTNGNFSNLNPNIYTVVITDANGCTASTLNNITQPIALSLNAITPTPPLCYNGTNGIITATTLGGSGTKTFIINPTNATNTTGTFINLLGNQTYTINVTDANNCSASGTVFITQPSEVIFNSLSKVNLTCFGALNGSITANASGGLNPITYTLLPTNISNNTGSFLNINGNTYTVIASDANNCTKSSTIIVLEPQGINFTNLNLNPVTCFGDGDGSISLVGTGGTGSLQYNLIPNGTNNSTGIFTNLSGFTYTVVITDGNNCTNSSIIIINEPNLLSITNINSINNICFGGSIGSFTITAMGGNGNNIYNLNPNSGSVTSNSISNLPANNYTIIVTDSKGCTSTSVSAITQPGAINLVLDSIKNLTCNGGNNAFLFSEATGGIGNYTYTLLPNNGSNSTGDFYNLGIGNYTIQVNDANNCSTQLNNLVISEPAPITLDTFFKKNVQCYSSVSGLIFATAIGGGGTFSYTLLPINETNTTGLFDSLQFGTYTLQITDTIGCVKDSIIMIEQNSEIVLIDVIYKDPTCFGATNGSIRFTPKGGVDPLLFSMDNGPFTADTFYQNLGSGPHFIKMVDSFNCTNDTILYLNQPDSLEIIIDSLIDVYCFPQKTGKIYAHAAGGNDLSYTYILSPVNKINSVGNFTNLGLGTYTLFVKDSLGCTSGKVVTLNESPFKMIPTITTTSLNCETGGRNATANISVTGGFSPYTYYWNNTPIDSSDFADSLDYGEYIVFIKDAAGCVITDTAFIEASNCCEVYIPNAFSPNNDGKNENWTPVSKGTIDEYYLIIFDRWGNKIFTSTETNKSWDGTYKGVAVNLETYYYLLTYKCTFDNQKRILKGDIILLK